MKLKYGAISATLLFVVGLAHPAHAQGRISAGQTVSGRLDASDYVRASDTTYYDDWFYEGRAGERIAVTQTSADFDPWLIIGRVLNGQFVPDEWTGKNASGSDARINYTLPAAGRYVIRANVVGRGRTGAYTLRVDRAGTTSTSSTATISPGSTLRGSLQPGDRQSTNGVYQDAYTFTGSKGDLVYVDMIASDFDPYVDLYRGSSAVTSDDDGGEGLNARVQHALTENGTYTIYARSRRPNQTGSYTLSFRSVPGQTGAGPAATTATGTLAPIAGAQTPSPGRRQEAVGPDPNGLYTVGLNQSVTGSLSFIDPELDAGIHYDTWKFSGRAGQRIRITLEADGFTPLLVFGLNDDSGDVITSDEDVAEGDDATIDFNIMVSGEYAILVTSHPQSAPFGGYRLTVRAR